jgi:hypothetical protein
LPDGQISSSADAAAVQPLSQKYSALAVGQIISTNSRHPVPQRGALRNVINAGRDAVDADGAARRTALDVDGKVVWS